MASLVVLVETKKNLLGHPPYSGDVDNLKKIVAGHSLLVRAVKRIVPALVGFASAP